MLLDVKKYGDPILRTKGTHVEDFGQELDQLANNMLETMYEHKGIGLAAQQVGVTLQLCVVDLQVKPEKVDFDFTYDGKCLPIELLMPMFIINPSLEIIPEPTAPYEEGCLSFPEITADVVRPVSIRASFQDLGGTPHSLTCNGLLSRVIQHEYDHLQGILFIDRMEKKVMKAISPKVQKLKRHATHNT